MFEFLGTFLWLIITGIASIGGYLTVKKFVRERLRFVEGVQKPGVPLLAGTATALVLIPAAMLPVVNVATAIIVGVGVGSGVAAGRRALKQLPSP